MPLPLCHRLRTAVRIMVAFAGLVALWAAPSSATPNPGESPATRRNPLSGARLWVDPYSPARRQVEAWRRSRPSDAAVLQRIADQPDAIWFGDWSSNVRTQVDQAVSNATRAGSLPVLVAYNIPNRDCGHFSAGGAARSEGYRRWIREFAAGLRGRRSVVILEPDALTVTDCLSAGAREQRFALLRDAVQVLKSKGAVVYLDAGTATWHRPDEMVQRLHRAGIGGADGFALNVSNFVGTRVNLAYGEQISRGIGGKHFVIDTSRNGAGVTRAGNWCNAPGMALGEPPTTRTGHPLVDAFLWVKRPGASDGYCNGGPRAGEWWAEYALGLAKRQTAASAWAYAARLEK